MAVESLSSPGKKPLRAAALAFGASVITDLLTWHIHAQLQGREPRMNPGPPMSGFSLSGQDGSLNGYSTQGYAILRNVLDQGVAAAYAELLATLVDQCSDDSRKILYQHQGSRGIRLINILGAEPKFAELIDTQPVFDVLLRLMGPYLRVVGSEGFIRGADERTVLHFHTDGGPAMQGIRIDHAAQALQLKVQFFLSDVDDEDSANFALLPASHTRLPSRLSFDGVVPEAGETRDGEMPEGAVQICANAGDALIFPYSLWHAVAPNQKGQVRKSVILRYGQTWHRPFDFDDGEIAEISGYLNRRQKRLLGIFEDGHSLHPWDRWYSPPDQYETIGLLH